MEYKDIVRATKRVVAEQKQLKEELDQYNPTDLPFLESYYPYTVANVSISLVDELLDDLLYDIDLDDDGSGYSEVELEIIAGGLAVVDVLIEEAEQQLENFEETLD